jgi:hypothetical protein
MEGLADSHLETKEEAIRGTGRISIKELVEYLGDEEGLYDNN